MKKIFSIVFFTILVTLAYSAPVLVPMNNAKEYARLSENKQVLLKGDYKTGKEDTLVVFSKMRHTPLNMVEAFRFSPQEDKLLLKSGNEYFVYRVGTNRAEKLSENGSQTAPIFSPDGNNVAFIRANNIFIKRLQFETEVQVTTDGGKEVSNGLHSQKITQAFGNLVSMAWSKDNSSLVYIKNQQVYVYNVQPGIEIDYATGDSQLAEENTAVKDDENAEIMQYVLNLNNKKFHEPDCSSVDDMKEENKQEYEGTREDLIEQGYDPCGRCKP